MMMLRESGGATHLTVIRRSGPAVRNGHLVVLEGVEYSCEDIRQLPTGKMATLRQGKKTLRGSLLSKRRRIDLEF